MEEFTATIEIEHVEPLLKSQFLEWEEKKLNDELDSCYSSPKLFKVGQVGMYDIVCRASRKKEANYQTLKFEDKWEFDGGYNCSGSCNRRGGFKSASEVIAFGIEAAKNRCLELEERRYGQTPL